MFLGLDIGASYCKAVLVDQGKKVLYSERVPMPSFLSQPAANNYIFEIEIERILDVVISLLRGVTLKADGDIQGIGVSGQMHAFCWWMKPVSPKQIL